MTNPTRNALSITQSALWAILSFGSLFQLNYSVFLLFFYAAHIRDDLPRVLPLALSELSKVFFEGFFFFGKIFPVGAKSVLPAEEIRTNKPETLKVSLAFAFVKAWEIAIGGTALLIIGANLPSKWVYILSLVVAVPWGLARLVKWLRQIITQYNKYDYLEDMSVGGQAINKIRARLLMEEQNELAILVYQSREMSRSTVINLVKFICGGLVVSFVISFIQELLVRIPK
ncbi:MAG: hypothetical protein WA821_09395 [Anaerolineales bacterium]